MKESRMFRLEQGLAYPDLANYRKDGYDFDARYEDGVAAYQDKMVCEIARFD